MFTIIKVTFKEALKKKVFHLMLIMTIIYLSIFIVLLYLVLQNLHEEKLSSIAIFYSISTFVSIFGFYFSSMITSLLTIMLSIGSISSEIENGTIETIISKPLKRSAYISGKFLGTALLIITYSIILYSLITIIPNLIYPSFIKNFGSLNLFRGLFFFILQSLVILAISLYGSISFKTLNNGIFVVSIYILSLIGGMIEQIGMAFDISQLTNFGIITSLLSPSDTIYRKMLSVIFTDIGFKNTLAGPALLASSLSTPSIWMLIYVFLYSGLFLFLAFRKFQKKDI